MNLKKHFCSIKRKSAKNKTNGEVGIFATIHPIISIIFQIFEEIIAFTVPSHLRACHHPMKRKKLKIQFVNFDKRPEQSQKECLATSNPANARIGFTRNTHVARVA